jgi:methylated-DNA-[protein]-cysteine S-methyltransferase
MSTADRHITVQEKRLPILGEVCIAATNVGVCAIALRTWNDHDLRLQRWIDDGFTVSYDKHPLATKALQELSAYTHGNTTPFSVPIDFRYLPDFTNRVLRHLLNVPHGELITYGQLAARVDSPKASQAVGGAVGRNPIPIIVPCHRVVAANGIGGFGLGLPCKRALLKIECIMLSK